MNRSELHPVLNTSRRPIRPLKTADRTHSVELVGSNMQAVQDGTSALVIGPGGDVARRSSPPKRTAAEIAGAPPASKLQENRASPRKTRVSARRALGGGYGSRRKPEPIDPDFNRSLPMQGVSPREAEDSQIPKRLFNPDRDDAKTFNPHNPQPGLRLSDDAPRRKEARRESRHHPGPTIQRRERDTERSQRPTTIAQRNDADGKDVPHSPSQVIFAVKDESEERLRMVRQPETRPISPEQLIAEVKGIYAGLIMVEAKCCEVDEKQHQAAMEMDGQQPLNNEQWQALIALHRTLLHEHHDFFLASQHSSASPSLKRLAHKYNMPARMWRHGIHSFLELLRHRLPDSLEQMLTFIYLAYSMMALLYETVPTFEDTWIECLGDLGRYRMAIEDDDIRDREVWQNVARFWYSKAADKTPYVGRLYHHLAILARPNILQQLFYYCKSLGVTQPFTSARESILTVFDPIFNPDVFGPRNQPDASFIQLHSITFTHIEFEKFDVTLDAFLDLLDKHISQPLPKLKVQGFYMAVCNITALYQYGARDSLLRRAWKEGRKQPAGDEEMQEAPATDAETGGVESGGAEIDGETAIDRLLPPYGAEQAKEKEATKDRDLDDNKDVNSASSQSIQGISLNVSKRLAFTILSLTLERINDFNVMPHWHAWMVFICHLTKSTPAMRLLENEFPWKPLIEMLNELYNHYSGDKEKIERKSFPVPEKGVGRPLPEDYNLRGFDWARNFPDAWFDVEYDDVERSQELPSMNNIRCERILWLAMRISAADNWIKFDSESKLFSIHPALELRVEQAMKKRAAVAAKTVEKLMVEDSDADMAAGFSNSEDEDYVMVVSEQVRKLKEKKRQLEAQLQAVTTAGGPVVTPETIAEVSRSAIVKGPEALHPEFTTFVVDTNLLVSHLETFNLITSKGWSVVIPNCVITELHGLGNNSGSVGDSAKSAMIAMNRVIAERKDVKIVTAKGNDVTKNGFFREKLERNDNETRNIDDIIIRTTRDQGELHRQAFTTEGKVTGNAETAILLTEDTNMRVKANALGVPAISTTVLKKYLVALGSRFKRKSTAPMAFKIKTEGIKVEDEDIMMADLPDVDAKPIGKWRNKRGKINGLPYAGVR